MTLQEYYNFPEGIVPQLKGIPHWLEDKPNFPCPVDMSYAFAYSKIAVVPPLDVSKVTNINFMFDNCRNLTSIDLSNWDTSNVTSMLSVFNYCTNLTSIDLSNWDTSKVNNMQGVFTYCENLTSIVLSNWDTSNVTAMNNMFSYCHKLTSLDLSSLDTSKVTNMDSMFYECKNLTSLSSLRADSLSISSYTSPFGYSNIKNLVDFGGFINLKSSWNGSYCVDKLTALSHQSLINILNGLYDFTGNGETPTSSQGKIKFGSTHLAKLSDDEKAIATNKGWTLS
jgi:surface protein